MSIISAFWNCQADVIYLFCVCSTRVSNELGAGNPYAARIAVYGVMSLAITETVIVSTTLFATRHVFGYLFSNEKEVVDYVTTMAPLVCLSVIIDSLQGVLSGNTCSLSRCIYRPTIFAAILSSFLISRVARG